MFTKSLKLVLLLAYCVAVQYHMNLMQCSVTDTDTNPTSNKIELNQTDKIKTYNSNYPVFLCILVSPITNTQTLRQREIHAVMNIEWLALGLLISTLPCLGLI